MESECGSQPNPAEFIQYAKWVVDLMYMNGQSWPSAKNACAFPTNSKRQKTTTNNVYESFIREGGLLQRFLLVSSDIHFEK